MKPSRILLDGTSCTCCSKNYNKEIRETLGEMGYNVKDNTLEVEKCFMVSEEDNNELTETGNNKKKNIRMDYCIPSKNIVIELNGGGNHYLKKHQDLDNWKKKICEKHGFKLVYIKTKGSKLDPNHKRILEEALEEDS
jgi:very-short-patch-repair endonuclease